MMETALQYAAKIPQDVRLIALAGLGGAAGSTVRAAIASELGPLASSTVAPWFPWHTFLVNTVGSALLGMLARLSAEYSWPKEALAFAGGGFCGGLTTFSGVAVEAAQLLSTDTRSDKGDSNWAAARGVGYVLTNQAATIACAAVAWWVSGVVVHRRWRRWLWGEGEREAPAIAPAVAPAPAPVATELVEVQPPPSAAAAAAAAEVPVSPLSPGGEAAAVAVAEGGIAEAELTAAGDAPQA